MKMICNSFGIPFNVSQLKAVRRKKWSLLPLRKGSELLSKRKSVCDFTFVRKTKVQETM
jgi:hypothetical protein